MMQAIKSAFARLFGQKPGDFPWWPGLKVAGWGFTLLFLALGTGLVIEAPLPAEGKLTWIRSFADMPTIAVYALATIASVVIFIGITWAIRAWLQDNRRKSRMKVIVIEFRGLRDLAGSPLLNAIPKELDGTRHQVMVDIRQGIVDGKITEPKAALEKLISAMKSLPSLTQGCAPEDINIVYGGLAPVPFTFLAGTCLDDERELIVMDWDRHTKCWRRSEGADDGRRFQIFGMKEVPADAKEVALVVSASYQIQHADVRLRLGKDMPIVSMTLLHVHDGSGWSLQQQQDLGKQFFQMAKDLGGIGIDRIHLFLAAENRLAFQFGQLYDLRNLPSVAIYQYQRENNPPHPWAVSLTAQGVTKATIVE